MRYDCFWEKYNKKSKKSKESAIQELSDMDYKEVPTCNGGDDDRIIIDNERKEWAFWEYGFFPFATNKEDYPTDKNLEYWYENAH